MVLIRRRRRRNKHTSEHNKHNRTRRYWRCFTSLCLSSRWVVPRKCHSIPSKDSKALIFSLFLYFSKIFEPISRVAAGPQTREDHTHHLPCVCGRRQVGVASCARGPLEHPSKATQQTSRTWNKSPGIHREMRVLGASYWNSISCWRPVWRFLLSLNIGLNMWCNKTSLSGKQSIREAHICFILIRNKF